ncbi:MAG: alpha/beta fold hydrolase [Anaerolineales bacterium]
MHLHLPSFTMHYEIYGRDTPLLLIHAFPLNCQMWAPQIGDLAKEVKLIIPDMRGFGESDQPPETYRMEILADDCMALLDAVGAVQPVVIGGLSMGGYISLAFYRKYPQKVAGLILAATRASADTPEGKSNREAAAEKTKTLGVGALVSDMLPKMMAPMTYTSHPELVMHVESMMQGASVNGVVGALLGMKERPDSQDLLTQIDVPTLILHGTDDQLIPPQAAESMHEKIKGSKLSLVADAGHLLNIEQPQRFNQDVVEFLRSI